MKTKKVENTPTEKREPAFLKIIKALEEYTDGPLEHSVYFSNRLIGEEIFKKLSREQIRDAALAFALVTNIPISQSLSGPALDHDIGGLLEDYLLDPKKREEINRLRHKWLREYMARN